jgi:hypothetical protein
MLRLFGMAQDGQAQHDRKIFSNFKNHPFVLPVLSSIEGSFVEGLRKGFPTPS